jgi:hypothetical protein
MAVTLVDAADSRRTLRANWWRWRPLVGHIGESGIVDAGRIEQMGYNANAEITNDEAHAIAGHLEQSVLSRMELGQRLMLEGTVTSEPDDATFYKDPEEWERNYSLEYEWLVGFIEFCRESNGFSVQ